MSQSPPASTAQVQRLERQVTELTERLRRIEHGISRALVLAAMVVLLVGQFVPLLRAAEEDSDGETETTRLVPAAWSFLRGEAELSDARMVAGVLIVVLLVLALAALGSAAWLLDGADGARTLRWGRVSGMALLGVSVLVAVLFRIVADHWETSAWSPATAALALGGVLTWAAATVRGHAS